MKRKIVYSTVLAVTLGVVSATGLSTSSDTNVYAKSKLARVISYKSLHKVPYNVNGGYLYTTARLNKKAHKATNYLSWTFYATKSAKVKKANGKVGTYYYLKSRNNKVRGWIWKGNLSKKVVMGSTSNTNSSNAYAQQKADIKSMLAIVRTMDSDDQDDALGEFKNITPKNAYDRDSLSMVFIDMGNAISFANQTEEIFKNGRAIESAYQLFKNRFSTTINNELAALSDRLNDALASQANDTTGIQDAGYNLASTLSSAIETLQKY